MKIVRSMWVTLMALTMLACAPRPMPEPTPGPPAHNSSWVDTARTVLTTVRWAVPAARIALDSILRDPARTQVDRALDVVRSAAETLDAAVAVYEREGRDTCAARAAALALTDALMQVGDLLIQNGVSFGRVLEGVTDGAAQVVDLLLSRCGTTSASTVSMGSRVNANLSSAESAWRSTHPQEILRHDLDELRP